MSALAPYGSSGLDWFAGVYPGGEAGLRTATEGRDATGRYAATAEYDPAMCTTEDPGWLNGAWSWLNSAVEPARAAGPRGRVADALDIDAFAVMGHSGGSSHALACAARLPDRVTAVVSMSALAPYGSSGLDWFAGMYPGGEAGLRTATEGRDAKERDEATAEHDPEMFTPEDHASLNGAWSWLNSVVEPALESGPGGLIDDDLAYVTPWDADPATIAVPTLIVHGGHDRIVPSAHGEWLASRIPGAELWLVPEAGHLSVLDTGERALAWLQQHTSR